jgi:oxygen-dependent protoporphyrinogen oxidase
VLLPRGPSALGADESVAAFGRRRLGRLAGERLLEPMVSGLYAGDPEQISLPAAFPLVAAMERDRRSFLLAVREEFAKAAASTAPQLASFREGLGELTSALAARLGGDLQLGCCLRRIARKGATFDVTLEEHGRSRCLAATAVALALPADAAQALVGPVDEMLAQTLAGIPYVPVALVHLGYPVAALARPLPAYGFFVPPSEPLQVLGGIFPSQFFPGRAPAGCHLFSVRTGGARHPEALTMSTDELVGFADRELRVLCGLARAPSFVHVVRHERALPQYTLGHPRRVAELAAGEDRHPGLFFHGNAYHNAGVPELVSRSAKLASRIATFVQTRA